MDGTVLPRLLENGSITWSSTQSMNIGSGYDARSQQVKRSPFQRLPPQSSVAVSPESAQVHLTYKSFRKVEDLESYMSNVTSASVGYAGVASIKAAASTLSSAKCNATNMTVVVRCTITLSAEHFDRDLVLTDEAESCLAAWQYPWSKANYNSDTFLEQYGQYCVTGYTRQASFFSTSTFEARTTEQLNQFAGQLGADYSSAVTSVNAATFHIQKMSLQNQETSSSHEIFVTGLNETSIQESFSDPTNVLKAWNTSLKGYACIPSVAYLQHYANLNVGGRIPGPNSATQLSILPMPLLQKSVLLGILARSSPMAGVREQQPAIDRLRRQLFDHDYDGRISGTELSILEAKIDQRMGWIGTCSLWSKRQKLVERILELCAQGHYWHL